MFKALRPRSQQDHDKVPQTCCNRRKVMAIATGTRVGYVLLSWSLGLWPMVLSFWLRDFLVQMHPRRTPHARARSSTLRSSGAERRLETLRRMGLHLLGCAVYHIGPRA